MSKKIALLTAILMALASAAGALILTAKIRAGERQIALGQQKLDASRPRIEEGKVALETGKQQSAAGKKKYEHAKNNVFLVLGDKLFGGGRGFQDAQTRIDDGDQRIAEGENRIGEGERDLAAGELELQQGTERLRLARVARTVCVISFVALAPVSLWLGLRWRRTTWLSGHPSA